MSPSPERQSAPQSPPFSRADAAIILFLAVAGLTVFSRAAGFDFIGMDDPYYVAANQHVHAGFATRSIVWALTSFQPDNWFPLTRLSHMLDWAVFGPRAPFHHAENILIHSFAAGALYLFLASATGRRWPSVFVAAVFALHPLHVESVAWISERKDVLCAFFWFAGLWTWARYAETGSRARYFDTILLFAGGLMSKPMIVTFPLVLLIVDFWPLRRPFTRRSIAEKLPFFALSAAVSLLTVIAQSSAGAVRSLHSVPLAFRIENALVSVAVYGVKAFWPANLSIFYPWPSARPVWQAVATAIGLAWVSLLAWRIRRTRPWFAAGWCWFLVTLVPVLGFVQVGLQSRADRYTYVPLTGIAIVAAWGVSDLVGRHRRIVPLAATAGAFVCGLLGYLSWIRTSDWKDSETLLRSAIKVNPRNYLAWHYLGRAMEVAPDVLPDVIASYRKAIAIKPDFEEAHDSLARALMASGDLPAAIPEFEAALRIAPGFTLARCGLGAALLNLGRTSEAISQFETAIERQPGFPMAENDLGVALWRRDPGNPAAIGHLQRATELLPAYPLARTNLGLALVSAPGRLSDAIWEFNQALAVEPDNAAAHLGLYEALMKEAVPSVAEAEAHLTAARLVESDPRRVRALAVLRPDDGSAH